MTNQKISRIFFYIFIFLLPWQTRLILFPEKSEFLGFSIYMSEIFLWLAMGFWLTSADLRKIKLPPVLMFLCFYVLVSFFWSSDRVAAFRLWLYIFEGIMVYLFLQNFTPPLKVENAQNQPPPLKVRGGWPPARLEKNGLILSDGFINKNISSQSNRPGEGELWNNKTGLIYIFLFSLFAASLFGIWQFFNLGSESFKWFGLAARGAWNLGDIVVMVGPSASSGLISERWLRAYGPFPHPNIFGGYLAAGILLIFYLKMNMQNVPRPRNILHDCFLYFFGGIFFFALFLTFSRSAWVALIAAGSYMIFKFFRNNSFTISVAVATDIVKNGRREILKFFIFLFFLAVIFSIIFWPFIKIRATSAGRLEQKSNTERVTGWKEGLAAWYKNPIFGIGVGNHTVGSLTPYSQPPHNIFILVLSQLGLAGFMIYLFVWKNFWKNSAIRPLLILFFVIGMFDHYLWTLYSGQMLFWGGIALTVCHNCDNL